MTAGIKANSDGSGAIQVGGSDVIGLGTTGNVNIPTSGARITGDFSNATVANRVMFQTSTVNSSTVVTSIPNGTGTTGGFFGFNNSDPINASFASVQANSGDVRYQSGITGTGTYLPMTFYTGGSEAMRIDTSRNVGIGTSSPTSVLDVLNATPKLTLRDAAGRTLVLYAPNSVDEGFIGTTSNHSLPFRTNNTERMRIASDGVITSGLGGMQVISGTSVSASGTAVTFTGIPSWVKRITVMFNGVSTSGTSNWLVQIGGGGSFAVAGYASSSSSGATTVATATSSAGFIIRANAASDLLHGAMQVFNVSGNVWAANHTMAPTAGAFYIGAGSTNIGVQLDRIRITTVNGTDTFDAGTINILYE